MGSPETEDVRKRRVFYIPGYDPIHPRRYRELYRKEGAAQAAISGYELTLSAKRTEGPYGWHVKSVVNGAWVDADVEVLLWSDIVRDSMSNSIPATYAQLVRTAWTYIASGALWRLMRLRKGPVIAALYPVGALILQAVIALGLGHLAGLGLAWLVGFVPLTGDGGSVLGARLMLEWVAYALGLAAAAIAVLRWFKAHDNKLFAYYLMHDYAYSARWNGATPPDLQARMDVFRARIAQALQDDVDEVLVVGHSSGAHLGVMVLADLIRAGEVPKDGPALAFLSLGEVVPMVSFLPDAWQLRRDLAFLAQSRWLTWVDVTAPGDGCAFALCDPVSVSGVAPRDKRWPLVFSAAFTQSLSPEKWQALKRRYFRLHFQYLCAFDRPRDYDYFLITAGPKRLATRYAGRPASKSRIERAVSKYKSKSP